MEFKYRYRIHPSDIWQVRMYYAYASYLAVVNIICIIASVILIVTQWRSAGAVLRAFMLIFLSLFLVVQPLAIYISSVSQAKGHPEELTLTFRPEGLMIQAEGRKEKHPWPDIISVTVRPTLVIIYTDASHGYILTNRILKETRKDFIAFVKENRKGGEA